MHEGRWDKVNYYQYRHDRARRMLRGIDEQIVEAEKGVAGKTAVKWIRFVKLVGGTKTVNRDTLLDAPSPAARDNVTRRLHPQL